MEQVTFEADNKKDVNLLIAIAEKLGIKKHIRSNKIMHEKIAEKIGLRKYIVSQAKSKKTKKRKDLFKIIDAGVDVSNFGDASEWQRKARKDRILK